MSLVDELREWADSDFPWILSSSACKDAQEEEMIINLKTLFEWFADRIEHEYLERPKFEDGEPIQFGDVVDCSGIEDDASPCRVDYISIYSDKSVRVGRDSFVNAACSANETIKRYIFETQEDINADIGKNPCAYWDSKGRSSCLMCCEDIGDICWKDMVFDLLKRQRELDERKSHDNRKNQQYSITSND